MITISINNGVSSKTLTIFSQSYHILTFQVIEDNIKGFNFQQFSKTDEPPYRLPKFSSAVLLEKVNHLRLMSLWIISALLQTSQSCDPVPTEREEEAVVTVVCSTLTQLMVILFLPDTPPPCPATQHKYQTTNIFLFHPKHSSLFFSFWNTC